MWWFSLFIFIILLVGTASIVFHSRKKPVAFKVKLKREPNLGINAETMPILTSNEPEEFARLIPKETKQSPFDPNSIVMQIRASTGRLYMGYELLQVLFETGFRFGEMDIFHRHEDLEGKGPILFSLAAATPSGTFELNNLGAISCAGLVIFMRLDNKKKLMDAFDLMLDAARKITEELGGEIVDEVGASLDTTVINNWRQRISNFEGKKFYSANLFDNL